MKESVCILVCLMLIVNTCWSQIVYPESVAFDERKSNAAGRLPVYAPTRCKQNELLFPGDQQDDWICDCAPANVYHPETDACYPAFRQGPCDGGKILVLRPLQIIPECVVNACKVDGLIPIKAKPKYECYELNKTGPCKDTDLPSVLAVDPKTLRVNCEPVSLTLQNRFGEDDQEKTLISYNLSEIDLCARGTKRAFQGRCPQH